MSKQQRVSYLDLYKLLLYVNCTDFFTDLIPYVFFLKLNKVNCMLPRSCLYIILHFKVPHHINLDILKP